ncbi:MAG: aminotransferase class IV [Aquificaceae bacterium]|nr:aminotransferase class IV [Aquificaceae bacterium]MCX8059916.1 aminotransferase class IV [Aquificaceae bacterium]MDW8097348.1 aminotransferase class IV [Aquificaceae bacterium]
MSRTLLFGEGLFETLRWKASEEKLLLHYQRLSNSARWLGIPCPSYEDFSREIQKATSGADGLYVKYLLLSRGGDYLADAPSGYSTLVVVKPLRAQPERVRLAVSSYRRHSSDPVCRHKSTSYLFNLLVKKEALRLGFWDALVQNEKGHLCETATSNLLLLKGSKFYTPARDSGLLWGTTLEFLSRRVEVREDYVKLSDLEKCDGLFVINSLLLCAAVEEVQGTSLRLDLQALKALLHTLKACLYSPPEEGLQGR